MIQMNRERVKRILSEPNGTEKLADRAEQAFDPAWALYCEEKSSAACAFLVRLAKQKKYREEIIARLASDKADILEGMLLAEDAKLRKNTARLMGALKDEKYTDSLIRSLDNESMRFVKPSIILAIGACGGDRARAFLEKYYIEPAMDESETTHVNEEKRALATALKNLTHMPKHEFISLDGEYDFELRAPDRLVGSLLYDLDEAGFEGYTHKGNSVFIKTADIEGLYKLRSMQSLLMPIAMSVEKVGTAELIACTRFIRDFFEGCCKGEPPYGYRIEMKGETEKKADKVYELASVIDSDKVKNSFSDYEIELIFESVRGKTNIYARATLIKDTRFDYREQSLPASIHPATAAAVLRYAMEHMKVNARVLDPCCGSGTLLIEREKLAPASNLTGVDIAHKAIDIARANAEKVESRAKFICNDMLRFEAKRPYDEVIANLPFGNRVGTHTSNERLYAGLLDKLPTWLNENGVAILYTMEFTLLKKLIRERPKLELVTETRTEAGGLMPGIFILKLK